MGEYLQEAVLPVQYDNYVFDLYGTLVDIHTEELAVIASVQYLPTRLIRVRAEV